MIFQRAFPIFLMSIFLAGCSFHYYDQKTRTEHIWGFGHMQMKLTLPDEGLKVALTGTEMFGLGFSRDEEDYHLLSGWRRNNTLNVLDEDGSVRVEWPTSNFLNIRIGSIPPFLLYKTYHQVHRKETTE